jgi:hypothetical protein
VWVRDEERIHTFGINYCTASTAIKFITADLEQEMKRLTHIFDI